MKSQIQITIEQSKLCVQTGVHLPRYNVYTAIHDWKALTNLQVIPRHICCCEGLFVGICRACARNWIVGIDFCCTLYIGVQIQSRKLCMSDCLFFGCLKMKNQLGSGSAERIMWDLVKSQKRATRTYLRACGI